MKKDRVKELEEELKRVKLKLADTVMQRDLLETLVDISSKHYKVDLKKNFGDQQLNKQERREDTKW